VNGLGGQQEDTEDEDENFSKREKTMKSDNLDYFTRLIKNKNDLALQLILNFFNQLLSQYEVSLLVFLKILCAY
jgi:hypothetical protein